MSDYDRKPNSQSAPSASEVAAEVAELGRIVAATWWAGAERLAALPSAVRPGAARAAREVVGDGEPEAEPSLRERGAELLRRSAEVHDRAEQHPAYRRILDELAPDEARILRLLAVEGPQPIVDVRSGLPPATRLVTPGLSMLGSDAGCRHSASIRAYLDNLSRLGLVSVASEAIADPMRYQVVEAQPDVQEALATAGRTGRTARRSVELTPFGRDFCEACLP